MRSAFALALHCVLLGRPCFGQAPPQATGSAAKDAPPPKIACEAGFEESFGDRPRSFYSVEIQLGPRTPDKPYVLFTRWKNTGTRAYYTVAVDQHRTSGSWRRSGKRWAFVNPRWTLSVSLDPTFPEAYFRVDGITIFARCGLDGKREPPTAGVALLRSPLFGERWKAAREALSDDYRLLIGPVTSAGAGHQLRVRVELRKQKTKTCSMRQEPKTPRLPYATVKATLERDGRAEWVVKQADLSIGHPLPPDPKSPDADRIASELAKHYGRAKTLEATYRSSTTSTGIFSFRRQSGLLRADSAGRTSLRADDGQRQVENGNTVVRFAAAGGRRKAPDPGPLATHSSALAFVGADLRDRFTLERSRNHERCSEDYVLVAIPKRPDPVARQLRLHVDRATATVKHVSVETQGYNYSISLEHEKLDRALPAGEFDLDPPPGAHVIDRTLLP